MDDELTKIYYDPRQGLLSAKKLWIKTGKKYPLKKVTEWVKQQEGDQILLGQKRRVVYPPIRAPSIGYYQADLLEVPRGGAYNKQVRYLLNVIDIYSRKAFSQPITRKTAENTLQAFKKMNLKNIKSIQTDDGNEFSGAFARYLKDNCIPHRVVYAGRKNIQGIVERFNQTLRNLIERYKLVMNTNKWINMLPFLIENYNTTYHSTIKMTPEDVWLGATPKNLTENTKRTYRAIQIAENFKIGDKVRTLVDRKTFNKGRQKFSSDIKTITNIDQWKYYVDDERRPYLYYELKKVNVVKRAPKRQQTKKVASKKVYKVGTVDRPNTRKNRVDLSKYDL